MKPLKKLLLLIIISTCLLLINCGEDNRPYLLPPATQIGANTAGAYINGELFVLSGNIGLQQTNPTVIYNGYFFKRYKSIIVSLDDYKFSQKAIIFILDFKTSIGVNKKIPLFLTHEELEEKREENKDSLLAASSVFFGESNIPFSAFDKRDNYIIFSKIDLQNKILSARFSFEAKNNKGELIKVTDGRFDLKVNVQIPKK